MAKTISQNGINLIKKFEGCVLHAYRDAVGVWTIGYGHTGNVKEGQTISQSQAETLLKNDLKRYEKGVLDAVKIELNANQFDACVSFAYNLGISAFSNSSLCDYINQKNFTAAANEFPKWCHAGGKVLAGLVKRRAEEKELFLKAVATPKPAPVAPAKVYYIIKKGDTLSAIAAKYKTTTANLQKMNNIANANKIYIGEKIRVK